MTAGVNLQALFGEANAAFSAGDLERARELARTIIGQAPRVPQVRHLLALVEKRRGDTAAARAQFAAAVELGPNDPQVHNNYANLLSDLGENALALDHYRRAVALKPDFVDALVNLAMTAETEERFVEARQALVAATGHRPDLANAWLMLGLIDRGEGDLEAAVASLDKAVTLAPADSKAARARATVEAERGGTDPAPYYARAEALTPGDLELFIARNAADPGGPPAIERHLTAKVNANPDWLDGHMALAQLRGQTRTVPPETSFEAALADRPRERQLWYGLVALLNRAERHAEARMAIERARVALIGDAEAAQVLDHLEAITADEAGDGAHAAKLLAALPPGDFTLELVRVRHALRHGRPDEAARLVEPLTATGSALAWAYLGTAWRLTGDARHDWLAGDDRLVQTLDIADAMPPLEELAARLRELHVTRSHPIDQSLRGGTQTDGDILIRSEPLMRQVRKALGDAIDLYVSRLPPPDPTHPTLKEPRNGARIVGGWSVRLSAQGFHINHVHPRGWLSSAFYVSLPPGVGEDESDTAGWLSIGVPPAELKLGLPPLRLIRPQPGRLALFPSIMWHGTVPFSDGERLTIAFDVAPRRG
ncbi:putative 2OG-Fe(II) oxygenase [Sphingoaurantiacus capsulatus]|uniref:2OG-Fe(II) oxygenase n=1 Tax=Sphingoaurantiacus capsulatus TaxID=1771310 RepID=A0ABV7XB24_9SPHN